MNNARDAFLKRVRDAVVEGNQAGKVPPLPERGHLGYQGGGDSLVQTFCDELAAAGGFGHIVTSESEAVTTILHLVEKTAGDTILLGRGPYIDPLRLADPLRAAGKKLLLADQSAPQDRDILYTADVGISGVAYLIAETGSVAVASAADDPRSVSLLPPVHIAVASEKQLLPDLFDFFAATPNDRASGIALITGPSKTGDIELKLVTGVHGPGEVHVVVCCWP